MKFGILAAMNEEVISLVEQLEDKKEIKKTNQVFYDGKINGIPVTVVQSGIGKVNASIATTLLIEEFTVEAIVNTGSAGGIGKGLKVGDLVVSSSLTYHDADATAFGYQMGQIPQMPEEYLADKELINSIEQSALENQWNVEKGLIVSGDSFIASKEKIAHILEHFPKAMVTEMEGAAVAQTCYQFNIPFAVIRALSDTADEEASVSFDEFVEQAGKDSAKLVLSILNRYRK